MADENNPSLRRRESGFLLRQLRTERGLSIDEVTDLCIVYGITDPTERERLMALAREGKWRAWLQLIPFAVGGHPGLGSNFVIHVYLESFADPRDTSEYSPSCNPWLWTQKVQLQWSR